MRQLHLYLTFNGNCREAMLFYQQCIGGKLTLQTVGDTPATAAMPACMRESIVHATLTSGRCVLMASDMVGDHGLVQGNACSLMLQCSSEQEIRTLYERLSSNGGQATSPLEDTFWGALFGTLTDRFGTQWLLHFDKHQDGV